MLWCTADVQDLVEASPGFGFFFFFLNGLNDLFQLCCQGLCFAGIQDGDSNQCICQSELGFMPDILALPYWFDSDQSWFVAPASSSGLSSEMTTPRYLNSITVSTFWLLIVIWTMLWELFVTKFILLAYISMFFVSESSFHTSVLVRFLPTISQMSSAKQRFVMIGLWYWQFLYELWLPSS